MNNVAGPCKCCGQWPTPKLTVDAAVVHGENVLLIRRGQEPFKGMLAFPGGFVSEGENPEDAVLRELKEETGLEGEVIEIMTVRGDPKRDPRGHIITLVYLINAQGIPRAGDDASDANWYPLHELNEPLAGDHSIILQNLQQLLLGIRPISDM